MSNTCGDCETTIDRRKPGITCSGFCEKSFHVSCSGISSEALKLIKTPGIFWFCTNCTKFKNDFHSYIKEAFESKINNMIESVENLFTEAKDIIVKTANDKLTKFQSPKAAESSKPLYSHITSNKSMVVVKPRNANQANAKTKQDLMNCINPVDSNIRVSKVKNISNGGILIGCTGDQEANKFKELASKQLSHDYDIREARNLNARFKVVGMTEKYSEDQLLHFIKNQNDVLNECVDCKVIKIWATKKNHDIYQAILEVDTATYCRVMNLENLFINFDSCIVYDSIVLKMCFNCSGFNHFQSKCKSKVLACPKCSLNHKVANCTSNDLKCVNCINAKCENSNHAAWDSNCSIYKQKLEQYKATIFKDI